jgi:hypothetical protein
MKRICIERRDAGTQRIEGAEGKVIRTPEFTPRLRVLFKINHIRSRNHFRFLILHKNDERFIFRFFLPS